MAKTLGTNASKPLGCFSKLNTNGSIYHPFINFKNHGKICDSNLNSNVMTITSFDLWISRFAHNTFALVTHFIKSQCVPSHVIVGLFEATNTTRVATTMQVGDFLNAQSTKFKFKIPLRGNFLLFHSFSTYTLIESAAF